jgi:hypothetical protein
LAEKAEEAAASTAHDEKLLPSDQRSSLMPLTLLTEYPPLLLYPATLSPQIPTVPLTVINPTLQGDGVGGNDLGTLKKIAGF